MSQKILETSMVARTAGLELNALLYAEVLPADVFGKARVVSAATSVYDINGDVLFYRVPIVKGRARIGYADIAANSAFSQPLLRAYPNNPDARKAIKAQAKCRKAA